LANAVNINSTVSSTSTTSGALTVAGGVGIGGGLNVNGSITATNIYINGYSVSTTTFTGGTVANAVNINNTTSSTSTTTGALTVSGGVGIRGNLTVGGAITATNIYVNGYAVSTATGAGTAFTGGTVANAVNINSTASSTSTTTGALTVIGGVGIGGNVYAAGTVNAQSYYVNGQVAAIISTNSGLRPVHSTTTESLSLIDVNLYGQYNVTALDRPLTIAITTSLSMPLDGQRLIIRIRDNGAVANSLNYTTGVGQLREVGLALPLLTILGRVLYIGAIYNQSENYWDVLSYQQQ
jgi:cytoskeletal protein CcmA (bactofilin family)